MMHAVKPNINRSREFEELIQNLANSKIDHGSRSLFPTLKSVLCFAAFLGFAHKNRRPLDPQIGTEDIAYSTFDNDGSYDYIFLIALAEVGNIEILRNGREHECVKIFEEYANGGMSIINGYFIRDPSSFLSVIEAVGDDHGLFPEMVAHGNASSVEF